MIRVHLTTELQADDYGPHEFFTERFVLPPSFAKDATEAHARLLTLIATEDYFELETDEGTLPLNTETIRRVAVWEG